MQKKEFSNFYIIKITESLSNAQWQQNAKQKVKSYTFTKKNRKIISHTMVKPPEEALKRNFGKN